MSLLRRIVFPGLLGLLLAGSVSAQVPRRPGPGLPAPLPPPALPGDPTAALAPQPVITRPAPPPLTEAADVKLQFPNAPVADVLAEYEALTGKHVLADPTVQGPVNINVSTYVTKSEAVTIIEVALTLSGFSLVPVDDHIVKVLGLSKNVKSSGVPIYFDLSLVPYSEQSVSFLLRLRYLDAQDVAGLLAPYIGTGTSNTGVTALPKAGALLLTDSGINIHRLVNMVNQIDLPAAPVTEKFIRLQRADASKAVEFLNSVFDLKSTTPGGGTPGTAGPNATRRPIRRVNDDGQIINDNLNPPATFGGQLPLLNGDSIIQGRITLTADVRTNRVHVVTSPVNMPLVEQLIADYDADAPFAEPVRYPLHFVKAKDVLPILVQSLTEPGTEAGANGGANTGQNRPAATPPPSRGSNGSTGNETENGGSGSGSGDSTIGQEELSVEPADTIPPRG